MEIFKWCIKNDIRVYRQPLTSGKNPNVILVMNYKGQIKKGTQVFQQHTQELLDKTAEAYKWAYDRANESIARQGKVKRDNY